jgi:hypothetical protein
MTNRSLAQIVLRIWGLVWILSAVGTLLQVASLVLSPAAPGGTAGYLKTAFVSIAMSGVVAPAILIFGSRRIASWLFSSEERVEADWASRSLVPALFAGVGISFALYALPNLVSAVLPGQQPALRRFSTSRGGEPFASTVQLVAGIAVFLGSGPLGKLWRRLQALGGAEDRDSGRHEG